MSQDIFGRPFDDGTKKKLEIFRKYFKSWLPTFIQKRELIWKDIIIYDFFAGEGRDCEGFSGSPLIILEELNKNSETLRKRKINVRVILNEKVKIKYQKLLLNVSPLLEKAPYKCDVENRDFKNLFDEVYPKMCKKKNKGLPRLIFLDQNGIKQITSEVFQRLMELKHTDILFFISSSFLRRFNKQPEFKNYIEITKSKFEESRPHHSHRVVFDYYKQKTIGLKYYLAPFSIKKGSNVYGLIFGSNHTLGIEKFLNVAWQLNSNSGDANYNIDEEAFLETKQMSIFMEENMPKKLVLFEENLKRFILNGEITTNYGIYDYAFDQGCLPKHANRVMRQLEKEMKINELPKTSRNIHKLNRTKIELLDA